MLFFLLEGLAYRIHGDQVCLDLRSLPSRDFTMATVRDFAESFRLSLLVAMGPCGSLGVGIRIVNDLHH